ncbi:Ferrochelatase [Corynebacterium glyciniphilum AJ 3170]|uniref:Coproporphyrin III ferrochelatase n=1 Tax=Corynebacterium glyciniphilum AJ 3170 TaxID=1404245 RepID=X5DNT2_9CORY|nr:ferrochelatase [Corynebacterium glyciniphilum]AHW62974.1 Ferrochelatase [Corynebacterium glyciniphilum AJ 3170]
MAESGMSGTTARRALLVLSFGGPEKEEDVVPFLENVTRGRGIPRERLVEVGEHYYRFGGKSPINDQNLDIIDHLRTEIESRGLDLPVYFGNRNWEPYVEDTTKQMAADGVTEAIVFATSAWGGYSGDIQYREDIERALQSCRDVGITPPSMTKIRPFHDHPLFLSAFARLVDEARQSLPVEQQDNARLLFTAHSVPLSADEASSVDSTHRYSGQVLTAAREIRALSSFASDGDDGTDVELVWQSRSGPPHIPWLEPDICDHLEETVAGERGDDRPIVLVPVGFISDHMEVMWDLDNEAADTAADLGVTMVRAATPGPTPEFTELVLDLVANAER